MTRGGTATSTSAFPKVWATLSPRTTAKPDWTPIRDLVAVEAPRLIGLRGVYEVTRRKVAADPRFGATVGWDGASE